MTKCEMCEGKGYEQIQSCYDEIHSRIECSYCMGDGIEIKDDEEKTEKGVSNEIN